MIYLIVLVGESASGKSTIENKLADYFDYEKYGREMNIYGWYVNSKAFNGYISILN